jgi:two-component system, NarL family, nitrate/nitrite response regulator NarL
VNDLRILIIAEDPLARAGLAMLLSDQPGCTVVGQLAGEAAQPSSLDTFQPDVLLWDLGWDPTLALEMLAGLSDAGLPLVALLTDETYAIEAWTAGAHGLLPRETDGANLRAALIAAAQGLVVLDSGAAATLLPAGGQAQPPPPGELTPREREVLQLLAEGLPNKSIASHLYISEHTVKFHVNAIMTKLGAQSRTDAVMRATRAGLILL